MKLNHSLTKAVNKKLNFFFIVKKKKKEINFMRKYK